MSHDLPPPEPSDNNDTTHEADTSPESVEETPEKKAHALWQAALRGIETEWERVSPSALKDRLGAAIVAKAFKDPGGQLHLTFRQKYGRPRMPWYKIGKGDEETPDKTP